MFTLIEGYKSIGTVTLCIILLNQILLIGNHKPTLREKSVMLIIPAAIEILIPNQYPGSFCQNVWEYVFVVHTSSYQEGKNNNEKTTGGNIMRK